MVKVAYVIDTLSIGGAERSIVALANGLERDAQSVITLYSGAALAPMIKFARIELSGEKRHYAWHSVYRRLSGILRAQRPDVIHASLFRSEQVARIAGYQLGIPVVSSIVSDSYGVARASLMMPRDRVKLSVVKALDAATAGLPSVYVANSNESAAAASRDLAIPASRLVVIPRGRDLERFHPADEVSRRLCRAEIGLAADERIAITVGRLIASKNHELILSALASARASFDRLVIVGDGPNRSRLECLARQLGLADVVVFLGVRNDVDNLLRAADVFIFASAFEGAPGAVIEALATGLPSVVIDIPSVREIANNSGAIFFAPGDVDACRRGAEELLNRPAEMRALLGRSARARAMDFSVQKMVDAHRELYLDVVRGRYA